MKARVFSVVLLAALAVSVALATPGTQLSGSERAARLKALPEEDRKWLEDYVAPIILPTEENLYLQLTEPHQREIFKEEFWKRREQTGLPRPLGPGYRNRYEQLREAASSVYGGILTDTGRLVVRQGEPDAVNEYPQCTNTFREIAVWRYERGGAGKPSKEYLFYRNGPETPWKLWFPGIPDKDVLAPSSCLRTVAEACRPIGAPASPGAGDGCNQNTAGQTCGPACDIVAAFERARVIGTAELNLALSEPPKVDLEGLDKLGERFASVQDGKAKELSVQGPGSQDAGTAVAPSSPSAKVTDAAAAPPDAAASRPAPARVKLSKSQMKHLYEELGQKYRDFLDLVELIITEDERQVFLQIKEGYQKDKFIDDFWKRRSIDSMGIRTDYRAVYSRRVQQAVEQFRDLHNDRAKIFVMRSSAKRVATVVDDSTSQRRPSPARKHPHEAIQSRNAGRRNLRYSSRNTTNSSTVPAAWTRRENR